MSKCTENCCATKTLLESAAKGNYLIGGWWCAGNVAPEDCRIGDYFTPPDEPGRVLIAAWISAIPAWGRLPGCKVQSIMIEGLSKPLFGFVQTELTEENKKKHEEICKEKMTFQGKFDI